MKKIKMLRIVFFNCYKINNKKEWSFNLLRFGKYPDDLYYLTIINFGICFGLAKPSS